MEYRGDEMRRYTPAPPVDFYFLNTARPSHYHDNLFIQLTVPHDTSLGSRYSWTALQIQLLGSSDDAHMPPYTQVNRKSNR